MPVDILFKEIACPEDWLLAHVDCSTWTAGCGEMDTTRIPVAGAAAVGIERGVWPR